MGFDTLFVSRMRLGSRLKQKYMDKFVAQRRPVQVSGVQVLFVDDTM